MAKPRTWVLFSDWWQSSRGLFTCVQIRSEHLNVFRARQIEKGARIIAIYHEKQLKEHRP